MVVCTNRIFTNIRYMGEKEGGVAWYRHTSWGLEPAVCKDHGLRVAATVAREYNPGNKRADIADPDDRALDCYVLAWAREGLVDIEVIALKKKTHEGVQRKRIM